MKTGSVRTLFIALFSALLLLHHSAAYSQDPQSNPSATPKEKLGESLIRLVRDSKTGELIDLSTLDAKPGLKLLSAHPPEEEPGESGDVVRLDSKLFAFEVTAINPATKRYVLDLKQSDFEIFEDNQRQDLGYFVRGEADRVPASIALILDHSGSVTPFWSDSRRAAMNFVRQLQPQFQQVALVLDDPTLLVDFTNDPRQLEHALAGVRLIYHTYNFTSLFATLKELMPSREGRRIVIFQTDGDEALKLVPRDKWPADVKDLQFEQPERNYTLDDIINTAANAGVTIYTIAVGTKLINLSSDQERQTKEREFVKAGHDEKLVPYFRECQLALERISKVSGGLLVHMEHASDADAIYRLIHEDLKARYIIGFYPPSAATRTGRFHEINVRVKGHPEYVVTGRKGFFTN